MTKYKPKAGGPQPPTKCSAFATAFKREYGSSDISNLLHDLTNSEEVVRHEAFDRCSEIIQKALCESSYLCLDESNDKLRDKTFYIACGTETRFDFHLDFHHWPACLLNSISGKEKKDIQQIFKIWKSLFHFLCLCDEQDVQDRYIARICMLSESIEALRLPGRKALWSFCAWYYISTRWSSLDQWRIDKLLYFVRILFESTIRNNDTVFCVALFNNFYADSKYKALGLHIIDIFLESSLKSPGVSENKFMELLIGLFLSLKLQCKQHIFNKRIEQWIIQPIVQGIFTDDIISNSLPLIVEHLSGLEASCDISPNQRRAVNEYLQVFRKKLTKET